MGVGVGVGVGVKISTRMEQRVPPTPAAHPNHTKLKQFKQIVRKCAVRFTLPVTRLRWPAS